MMTGGQRPVLMQLEWTSDPRANRELLQRVAKAGFDGVELDFSTCAGLQVAIDAAGDEAIAELLTTGRMSTSALAVQCAGTNVVDATLQLSRLLERLAGLSIRCVNLSLPSVRSGKTEAGLACHQQVINFGYTLLRETRLEAEAAGVALAIEAAQQGVLMSPMEARELIDAANSALIGVCLDVARIEAIGCPADWITSLHRRVRAVRVHAGMFEGGDDQRGRASTTALDDLVPALSGVAFRGPVILRGLGGGQEIEPLLSRWRGIESSSAHH